MRKIAIVIVVGIVFIWGMILGTDASGQEKIKIRYWTFIDSGAPGGRSQAQRKIIESFEASHPNIDIVEEVIVWNKIASRLVTATASGEGPDVCRVAAEDLGLYVAAKVAEPLDPFVSKWGSGQKADWLIPWDTTVFGGQKLFLPIEHRIWTLWYRKDLLDAAGLRVPRDCSELAQAAIKVQTDKVSGLVMHLSPTDQAFGLGIWMIQTLWSSGKDIVNKDGTTTFNSEPGVKLLEWIDDLVKKGGMKKEVIGMDAEAVLNAYRAGNACFFLEGTHRVVTGRESAAVGDKLQVALPVTFKEYGYPAKGIVEGWNLLVGVNSKHKKEAFEFIEHHVSPEMQMINVQLAGELPSRKSPYGNSWFTASNASPDAKEKLEWSKWINQYGRVGMFNEDFLAWREELMRACHDVLLGRNSPKKALDEYAEKFNKRRITR